MSGRYLLDTNIVIALFAQELSLQKRLAEDIEVFIPVIVLGELYYGAMKSARVEENLERIDDFAAINTVLVCNITTARNYAIIKEALREKGRPIPENDIWIASIAQQYLLTLVTRDKHFDEIDGLTVEIW
jgi:tRNA(fMet)-specific endonuclease VapC